MREDSPKRKKRIQKHIVLLGTILRKRRMIIIPKIICSIFHYRAGMTRSYLFSIFVTTGDDSERAVPSFLFKHSTNSIFRFFTIFLIEQKE